MFKKIMLTHLLIATVLVSSHLVNGGVNYDSLGVKKKLNQKTDAFPVSTGNKCLLCELVVKSVLNLAKTDQPFAVIKLTIMPMCLGLGYKKSVCSNIIDVFGPVLVDALKMTSTSPRQICTMFLEGVCPYTSIPEHEWTVELPNVAKPPPKEVPLPPVDGQKLKVLQLSDIHLDLQYSEGSNANCDEPLCCRKFSVPKKNGVIFPAGRWGDYNCDLPLHTLEKTLEQIAAQHSDVDYIMWLGDTVPHDIWRVTKSEMLEAFTTTVQLLNRYFPNTKILPVIGNHDVIPEGSFTPLWVQDPKYSMSWLLPKLYTLWEDWIPRTEKNTFLSNGYYIVDIRPSFKIISLNMNYCFNLNWWLYVNSTDPGRQLEWLAQQLQQAENTGEKVHIIGHIPPGDTTCLKTWSENYYKIISRYEDTVTAQFFAHTHKDEFVVFYDAENYERPLSVGYIGPSLTPYDGGNPAYKIFYIDESSSWKVLNYETWVFDLDKTNSEKQQTLNWQRSYDAKDTYNFSSLAPVEWDNLIDRMENDDVLFKTFYKNHHRDSPVSKPITSQIKKEVLCYLRSGKSHSQEIFCNKN